MRVGYLGYRAIFLVLILSLGCGSFRNQSTIQDIKGIHTSNSKQIWLTHEHLLVDFSGADQIDSDDWNHDVVLKKMTPYLEALIDFDVDYFVDATPNYLGRDVLLLEKFASKTGLKIITNTGLYGAGNNKYIPQYAHGMMADSLAKMWIDEFDHGIDGTSIKPGFIKISVDNSDPLSEMHQKIVKAAALTHLETGLTIASHTGRAKGLWPQLDILEALGVSPESFIWVHAQAEDNFDSYLKASERKCWISLDGLGWELDDHVEKIVFAKENGFLDRILISHDAGWYDPQKEEQSIQPFTNIFKKLYPRLKSHGFTEEEFELLVSVNPAKAFSIKVRKLRLD